MKRTRIIIEIEWNNKHNNANQLRELNQLKNTIINEIERRSIITNYAIYES